MEDLIDLMADGIVDKFVGSMIKMPDDARDFWTNELARFLDLDNGFSKKLGEKRCEELHPTFLFISRELSKRTESPMEFIYILNRIRITSIISAICSHGND